MQNSFTISIPLTCPNCGTDWIVEPWLLIDTSEKPDLVPRLLDGSIDHVFCPECHEPALNLFPLLLFRPGVEPPFLLSTDQGKRPEGEAWDAVVGAIGHLRGQLGAEFKPEWLAKGVPVISRQVLPEFLRQEFPEASEKPDPIVALLMQYLRAKTWTRNRELLESHPELLDPQLESTIADLTLDDEPRFQRELEILRRCRHEGVEEVFEGLFGDDVLIKLQKAETLLAEGAHAEAFQLLKEASSECDRGKYPRPWAWIHFATGSCLIAAPLLPEPLRWEHAIASLRRALTVYTQEEDPQNGAPPTPIWRRHTGIWNPAIRCRRKMSSCDASLVHWRPLLPRRTSRTGPDCRKCRQYCLSSGGRGTEPNPWIGRSPR